MICCKNKKTLFVTFNSAGKWVEYINCGALYLNGERK